MHIGNKIKTEVANRGFNVTEFSKLINKSRPYVYSIFEKEHIDTALLCQIAEVLNIPVSSFFDDTKYNQSISGNSNILVGRDNNGKITHATKEEINSTEEINRLTEEIRIKNNLLDEKERLINVLLKNSVEPLIEVYTINGIKSINLHEIRNIIPCTGKEPQFIDRINSGSGNEYPCCIIRIKDNELFVMQDSEYIWKLITNKLASIFKH